MPEVPSSGLPSPPSSPPLAALTSANELALTPKHAPRKRDHEGRTKGRRGGAANQIREKCERLFCGSMKSVFLVESNTESRDPVGLGALSNKSSPPEEVGIHTKEKENYFSTDRGNPSAVSEWLEIWDYAGGCSFRAFIAGSGEKRSLFAFFDSAVVSRDLKQGLMAVIELADTALECSQVVICLERSIEAEESRAMMKSLRWVGFELITLDLWSQSGASASDQWTFLGMEL